MLWAHKANLIGNCSECDEPTTGDFDSDRDRVYGDDDLFQTTLKCVNCGYEFNYNVFPQIECELIEDSD